MGLSNKIPELKNELLNGVHECLVGDVYLLKEDGFPVMQNGDYVVVLSFSCGSLTSEKAFKLGSDFEFKEYKKLLAILGVQLVNDYYKRQDMIGKKVAVFVQKITNRESGEVSYKIVNFKPSGKNYKHLTSEIFI